ncbi:MAG: hypothetical protein GXP46_10910 [Deferribacteres bacterium]|nr:hypothetical protein [Deferribacteres bacterium]
MKRVGWQVILGAALVSLSAVLYYLHYTIFRDAHHIFIYLLGDIAFVPIEVLLVTLIIHRLLHYRERRLLMQKLNMVIGAFFSEVGTGLLESLSSFDSGSLKNNKYFLVDGDWTAKDFTAAVRFAENLDPSVDTRKGNLTDLRDLLEEKKAFMLRLLENQSLLEHDSFTELLWAVFHLSEELTARPDLSALPEKDYEHLAGDINRAYRHLTSEWLKYMRHLKNDYPYLFSLAVRVNPFKTDPSPVIRD